MFKSTCKTTFVAAALSLTASCASLTGQNAPTKNAPTNTSSTQQKEEKKLDGTPLYLCEDIFKKTKGLHEELGAAWGFMHKEIEDLDDAKDWLGLVGTKTPEQEALRRSLLKRLWDNRGSASPLVKWLRDDDDKPAYTCLP